jgi:hypothetical protein
VAKDVAYAGKKDKSKKQKGLFLGPRQKKQKVTKDSSPKVLAFYAAFNAFAGLDFYF